MRFLDRDYLDRNRFYIVPKNELRLVRVVDKDRWRFTLSVDEEGIPHKGKEIFLDA